MYDSIIKLKRRLIGPRWIRSIDVVYLSQEFFYLGIVENIKLLEIFNIYKIQNIFIGNIEPIKKYINPRVVYTYFASTKTGVTAFKY